jgi:hypothetical protein
MAGGGEAPLLEGKPRVYFDGCPGCANDRRKAENLGIPYGQFFHIWIIILVSCTCIHPSISCIVFGNSSLLFTSAIYINLFSPDHCHICT